MQIQLTVVRYSRYRPTICFSSMVAVHSAGTIIVHVVYGINTIQYNCIIIRNPVIYISKNKPNPSNPTLNPNPNHRCYQVKQNLKIATGL